MERDAAALAAMLDAHPRAWVGAVGPDALYVPIPASVPVTDGHRRIQGRWALDHVGVGNRAPMSELWRRLRRAGHGHDRVEVSLVSGGAAEFHLFMVADDHGADILLVLTDDDADLGAPPIVHDLAVSSRFTRVLRDQAGLTMEIDDAAPDVLGWTANELLGRTPPLDRVHPDDRHDVIENWMATLTDATTGHRSRIRLLRSDGSYRWFEVTNFNRLDDPHTPCVTSEFLDISEEMAAHEAVRAREQLLHRLAEALPLGVLQLDVDGRVVYKNDYLGSIVGADGASTMAEQFAGVVADDLPLLERAFATALDTGADDDVVVRTAPSHDRTECLIRVITKSLHDDGGGASGVIACISDVTETERMGRELERRATYDALTGCLNRATILARLEDGLAPREDMRRDGTAAIFLDLDGFKDVNDRRGHAEGDEVLKTVGRVLASTTRESDAVGRLGGDEFLVVCTGVAGEHEAVELASRISAAIDRLPTVPGAHRALRASIGVAWAPRGAMSADALVERADAAMYASKRAGIGAPHVWRDAPALAARTS